MRFNNAAPVTYRRSGRREGTGIVSGVVNTRCHAKPWPGWLPVTDYEANAMRA